MKGILLTICGGCFVAVGYMAAQQDHLAALLLFGIAMQAGYFGMKESA